MVSMCFVSMNDKVRRDKVFLCEEGVCVITESIICVLKCMSYVDNCLVLLVLLTIFKVISKWNLSIST